VTNENPPNIWGIFLFSHRARHLRRPLRGGFEEVGKMFVKEFVGFCVWF